MIKRSREQESEVRENMRGGLGKITITHYFKKDEIKAACRLCAKLVVPPEAGIGLHEHNNEDEVFIIQQGTGIIIDNDEEVVVEAGDSILTGGGGTHALKNTGKQDLIVTAFIMKYN